MKDVSLKIVPGGKLAESTGTARGEGFTVLDVPEDVSVSDVILQMSRVVIMPMRSQAVPWQAVVGKPQGAIVHVGPKTVGQRVDAHDSRLISQGGRKLNGIRLSPEAADALAALESAGETATAAINRLLLDSRAE